MIPRVTAVAICCLLGPYMTAAAIAQDNVIIVQANGAQKEIERILDLDNLEVELLHPRDVAAAMASIRKGRAPSDFWVAYQSHVKAWQRYATASGSPLSLTIEPTKDDFAGRAEARLAIDSTFDEVERIARRYGARIPMPRTRAALSY